MILIDSAFSVAITVNMMAASLRLGSDGKSLIFS